MNDINYIIVVNFWYSLFLVYTSFISIDNLVFAIVLILLIGEPLTLYLSNKF